MEERYGLSDVFRGSAGSQKIMKHGGPDRARVIDRLDALLAQEEPPEELLNAIYRPSNLHLLAEEGEEATRNAWQWFREQFGAAKTADERRPALTYRTVLLKKFGEALRQAALNAHELAKLHGIEDEAAHWRYAAADLADRAVIALNAAKTAEAEEGEQFRTAELAAQVKERNDMMSQGWLNNAFNPAPAFAVCGEHGYCQLPAGHDGEHMGPPSHQPSDAD